MAIKSFLVELDDESMEYKELEFMLQQAQLSNPNLTMKQYGTNIVRGHLSNRVLNVYRAFVGTLSSNAAAEILGDINSIRS